MPFFLIAPIWLLCAPIGLAMLASPRVRFLASYLILGSTFAFVAALALSTLALILLPRFMTMIGCHGSLGGIVVILCYLAGIVAGALVGVALGGWTAYRVNRLAGLSRPN